uniref:Uncharacterized protein n=1 Tax=Anopheles atroparvus TaxID=41427 RepID=A0AAG5CPC0_ANOAO
SNCGGTQLAEVRCPDARIFPGVSCERAVLASAFRLKVETKTKGGQAGAGDSALVGGEEHGSVNTISTRISSSLFPFSLPNPPTGTTAPETPEWLPPREARARATNRRRARMKPSRPKSSTGNCQPKRT